LRYIVREKNLPITFYKEKFMIKKCLSLWLICLLLVTASSTLVSAQSQTGQTASNLVKVKDAVLKRGKGEKSRVEVKMLNGTKLRGYISESKEDSFTLVDAKTKQPAAIAYSDVAKVSNRLSKGDKIALGIIAGAGITAAVVLAVFLGKYCNNEGC
jgi:sRNA-binding regulator protein Hfq